MTGEEIVKALDAENRRVLIAAGDLTVERLLQMLNEAGVRGFRLGSDVTIASLKGALALKRVAAA